MRTLILCSSLFFIYGNIFAQSIERQDDAVELNITGLSGSLQNPAFSPDGEFIVFTHFINGYNNEPADLYIYELETEELTLLVSSSISSPDFHLQNSSPAINAGDPDFIADASETDIDGENRIMNDRVDIGADESTYGTGIINKTTINRIILYPNPSNGLIEILCETEMDTEKLHYDIINYQGQIVIHNNLKNGLINIRNLNSGVYLLIIKNNQDRVLYSSQFIKN